MLDECEQKDAYVECNVCGEAVLAEELKEHQADGKVCFKRKPGKVSSMNLTNLKLLKRPFVHFATKNLTTLSRPGVII